MCPSAQIMPISYFQANAVEIVGGMNDGDPLLFITRRGEAAAALQNVVDYERTQDELVRLDLLAMPRAPT